MTKYTKMHSICFGATKQHLNIILQAQTFPWIVGQIVIVFIQIFVRLYALS